MTTDAPPVALAAFLLARFQEDESFARDTEHAGPLGAHVLADIAAKRRIVQRYLEVREGFEGTVALYSGPDSPSWNGAMEPDLQERLDQDERVIDELEDVLKLLALPYASDPGFRPEWRA